MAEEKGKLKPGRKFLEARVSHHLPSRQQMLSAELGAIELKRLNAEPVPENCSCKRVEIKFTELQKFYSFTGNNCYQTDILLLDLFIDL